MTYDATDIIPAAQHPGCIFYLAEADFGADQAGRNRHIMIGYGFNHVNFITCFFTDGCQSFNVALTIAAQCKIIPNPQAAQAEMNGQHLHEFSRAKTG